ncbi:PAS domain S-box protein [Halovenus sp. HT40]|uniref:PAS domain S-box protein n=1 Tax=Halovenus sp. HT40 TaxID=3126691 RepID=UPI00300EA3B8
MSGGEEIDVLYVSGDQAAEELELDSNRLSVETAPGVEQALGKQVNREFDCLVSAYDLPDGDGVELLETVRTKDPDLPFVLYAEQGSEAVASRAISADVTEYLRKDEHTSQTLESRIREAVDQYRDCREISDRHEQLSLFIEQCPLGVIEWNDNFEIVSVNPACEEILGYSEEELLGESWRKIVPETAESEIDTLVNNLLEVEGGFHSVNENRTKTGEQIVCEWHNRVVTDGDGDVVTAYSQFQDITNRRSREEAIAELHEIVDDLAACSSQQEIYERTIDAAGRILNFDQAAIAIENDGHLNVEAMSEHVPFEVPPSLEVDEGLAGKTYQQDEAYLIDDVSETSAANPQTDEIRSAISVPISGYGVFQVIDSALGAFERQDVELAKLLVQHTETALDRLGREQELEQIYEQVEFALDATDSVIWAVDLEANEIQTGLGPSERLFGVSSEQIAGLGPFLQESVHPDDVEEMRDVVQRVRNGEKGVFSYVFRKNPKYGDHRWLEALGYIQEDGGPKRVIGLTTDVTEREQREQELQRQNERLEQFTSVVSHDLRNPLQVANSWLSLAEEDCESEYLEKVGEAHERMDVLIEELLRLAREGDRALETERIDLDACARACWETVDTGDAGLLVDVDGALTADRNRFRQLLANLFRNAVEHGSTNPDSHTRQDAVEHGGDAVTVTLGRLPEGFYVEDDGPGIPPERREEVFESGYSATEDGTGFGLSIVARVVDAHGWEIQATEGSTGGARFEITGVESIEE